MAETPLQWSGPTGLRNVDAAVGELPIGVENSLCNEEFSSGPTT